jgi:iron-sulfur cluster repair di-iron protein
MKIETTTPIGQIVIEMPEAASIFEGYKINYYKDRGQTLQEACAAAGVIFEQVESQLKKHETPMDNGQRQAPDWDRETMAAIVHHIIRAHHVKTRTLLKKIDEEITQLSMQESGHSKMEVIRKLFEDFDAKLEAHMLEEEREVFPFLIYAERALKKGADATVVIPSNDNFTDSIREILFDHRFMDRGFNEMQKLVFLFNESNGKKRLDILSEALKELSDDNQKHVHLENDILLKKAAQIGLME